MSQKSHTKTPKAPTPQKNYRLTERGRKLRDATMVLLALGAAATYAVKSGADQQTSKQHTKIEALESGHTVMESIIVLKAGSHVHSTPIGASDANNRVATVGQGQEWVIHTPLVTQQPNTYTSLESGWIAFTPPKTKQSHTLEGRADATVYANLLSLANQDMVQVYSYPAQASDNVPGESGDSQSLSATVMADGSISITAPPSPNVMDAKPFVDQLTATSYQEPAGQYALQVQSNATPTQAQQVLLTFHN